MRYLFWTIYLFTACVSFNSCKKSNVAGPQGPQGPGGINGDSTLSGYIKGKVVLYDSAGIAVGDNSNVSVAIENSNPLIVSTSATDGTYISPSFSSGIYDLSFSKDGYGTMKLFGFQNPGGPNGGQAGIVEMGHKLSSWFDIKSLQIDTINDNGWRYMLLTISLAHPLKLNYGWVVLFFYHDQGAGNTVNDFTFRTVAYKINDSTMSLQFDQDYTGYTTKLNGASVYVTSAFDNPKFFNYTDSLGNSVYPASGSLSNEVVVPNIFKK